MTFSGGLKLLVGLIILKTHIICQDILLNPKLFVGNAKKLLNLY